MNKKDLDFLMQVAKKADDAMKIALEAKIIASLHVSDIQSPTVESLNATTEPTQTQVVFENPLELKKHGASIFQLNQEIDKLCKLTGVKELKVTYRK